MQSVALEQVGKRVEVQLRPVPPGALEDGHDVGRFSCAEGRDLGELPVPTGGYGRDGDAVW